MASFKFANAYAFAFALVLSGDVYCSEIEGNLDQISRFATDGRKFIGMVERFKSPVEFRCYANAILPDWRNMLNDGLVVPPSLLTVFDDIPANARGRKIITPLLLARRVSPELEALFRENGAHR